MNALMKLLGAAIFFRRRKTSQLWHSSAYIPPIVYQVPACLRRNGGLVMTTHPNYGR